MKTNLASAHFLLLTQVLTILLGASCLLVFNNVNAELLVDPTQPPASLYGSSGEGGDAATGPVLQSVMIGSKYKAAIISGQKVMLGGKYEEATLIRLSEHEAILRYADKSTQKLEMNYAIDKKIVSPVTPASVKKQKLNAQPVQNKH